MKSSHEILIDYGIKSMTHKITAYNVQKLLDKIQIDFYNESVVNEKNAYNQGVEDSYKNAKASYMVIENYDIKGNEKIEAFVIGDSILKLKIN